MIYAIIITLLFTSILALVWTDVILKHHEDCSDEDSIEDEIDPKG